MTHSATSHTAIRKQKATTASTARAATLNHHKPAVKPVGSFKAFKAKALARPEVKTAYDALAPEFAYIDTLLKARLSAGLTQQDVAARIGTTQSAIARLESGRSAHAPSLTTLHKYAKAVGKRLVVRLA